VSGRRFPALVLLACILVVVGACASPGALRQASSPEASSSEVHTRYYIELPDISGDPKDGYWSLEASTNLPEGTKYQVSTADVSGSEAGAECCQAISGRRIRFKIGDDVCARGVGVRGPPGASIDFTVPSEFAPSRVGPVFRSSPPPPPRQPASVLSVLGASFEYLTGEQVRTSENGTRELVASKTYRWEPMICDIRHSHLNPQRCSASVNGERLQGGPDSILVDLRGALGQARLCEIWFEMTTPGFRSTHPWEEFRDRMEDWLEGLTRFGPIDVWKEQGLTSAFVHRTDEHVVADLYFRDHRVAQIEASHLPNPPGFDDPTLVPFWGFGRIELYDD
jgi:hypothetical protein